MRTLIAPLAIAVLFFVTQCGGKALQPGGNGGDGGSPAAGTGGGGGGTGGGGTAGVGTAGGGGGGGWDCALGGSPPWCEGDIFHPGGPMCSGPSPPPPSPSPTPGGQCSGDTPLCEAVCLGGSPCHIGCTTCPGSGGPSMVSIGYVCVDSTEVTRADYSAWLATKPSTAKQVSGCEGNSSFDPDPTCMSQPDVCASNCDSHPQTCVNWCDASAYCASVGKQLCATFANSGSWQPQNPNELGQACQDNTTEQYPYGQSPLPSACDGSDLGTGTTVPVGSLTKCARTYSDGTIYDLVGNVWEWEGTCDTSGCIARGGSYKETSKANTCSAQSSPYPRDYVASDLGFRCCAP